jgi:hypothetical protein
MPYTQNELEMLEEWKNRAMGYRWLHYESMRFFKKINMRFVHASILLSTVASASGFSFTGSDTFGKGIGYAVGALNVIIGLLNSYQRFTKAAEQSELHGSVAMQYGMLYRLLDIELQLGEDRQRTDLIPFARQEMDRLFVHSSLIPGKIVVKYMNEFPNAKNKPELCDEIVVVETPLANESLASILQSGTPLPRLRVKKTHTNSDTSTPIHTRLAEVMTEATHKIATPIPSTSLESIPDNASERSYTSTRSGHSGHTGHSGQSGNITQSAAAVPEPAPVEVQPEPALVPAQTEPDPLPVPAQTEPEPSS